jgi:tRNA-dihydrouridine synthase
LVTHCPSKKQPKNYDAYFGNGDIDSPEKALKYKMNGIDGIMIGRAAIGYPWILMKLSIILILENIWLNRQLLIECKQYVIIVGDGMERRT